jgi:cytosine/uracil/thiamine/allantoin permease
VALVVLMVVVVVVATVAVAVAVAQYELFGQALQTLLELSHQQIQVTCKEISWQ